MEIEFNPSRVQQAESNPMVARQRLTPAASDKTSFTASASLKGHLKEISTVRSEEVGRAQSLISKGHYPPDDILDRMAVLLAVHLKGGQSNQ